MAVESRFVVIRDGVEAKTFMDKKSADEYDKMLDMADNLADVFTQSPVELNEGMIEELSVFLAQHREDVLVALLAKKAAKPTTVKSVAKVDTKKVEIKAIDLADDNKSEVAIVKAVPTKVASVKAKNKAKVSKVEKTA